MHYSIAVITQSPQNVEKVLAQYDENLEVQEIEAENGDDFDMFNPNGRWDWYQIGGRWAGLLKVKQKDANNAPGCRGEASFLTDGTAYVVSEEDKKQGIIYVDSAKIKHIQNLKEILANNIYGYVSSIGWKDEWECCQNPVENPQYPGQTEESPEKVKTFYEDMTAFVESHPEYYLTIVDCHN